MTISLPQPDGGWAPYALSGNIITAPHAAGFKTRTAYAAAHVVVDPLRTIEIASPVLDWDSTLAFRRHLWSLGFAVAEAMDTAQRGMGLDWALARELIERSAREAKAVGGTIACGAGTDHLAAGREYTLAAIAEAYVTQCAAVEATGSRIILMASRALARVPRSPEEYAQVYGEVLRQVSQPVILHWLGPMFDPALAGYWGTENVVDAVEHCLAIIHEHADKVDGIKISLLDAELEVMMRRRLPASVRMYTGDDFNFDRLIEGDEKGFSHALLGIFDPIAPVAAAALHALDAGDTAQYRNLLAPTVPLSRHIFQAPTFHYKTGVVFMAYLNGFQKHFRMVGGAESARSVAHLVELFRLADQAGLLLNPEMAVERMQLFLRQSVG